MNLETSKLVTLDMPRAFIINEVQNESENFLESKLILKVNILLSQRKMNPKHVDYIFQPYSGSQ